jgi:hypothetical protein
MTTIALALVMAMISPLASADNSNDQSKHDDGDKSKCPDNSDKSKCNDDGDKSKTQADDAKWKSDIEKTIAFLTDKINKLTSSSTGQSLTDTSPTAIYTHLEVGTCTIDPITSVSQGWCPDGTKHEFFIPDSTVTKYSVISVTTVPTLVSPLTAVQCTEETLNYNVGANQGFGIFCNASVLPGAGLNYIVFNPSPNWLNTHPLAK